MLRDGMSYLESLRAVGLKGMVILWHETFYRVTCQIYAYSKLPSNNILVTLDWLFGVEVAAATAYHVRSGSIPGSS